MNLPCLYFPCLWAAMKQEPTGAATLTLTAEFTRTGKTGKPTTAYQCSSMLTRNEDSTLVAGIMHTNLMRNVIPMLLLVLLHSVTYHPGFSGKPT